VRVELYGDLVLSMKPFDPIEQTTRKDAAEIKQVWLPPVREAIVEPRNIARARERIAQLAEMMDWPTTKTRALVDDVVHGRAFFGAEGYLPAYYEELDPLLAYVPDGTVIVLDDPPSVTRAVREEIAAAERDAAEKEKAAPAFLPSAFYRDEEAIVRDLAARPVVSLHRTPIVGAADSGLEAFERAVDALDLAAPGHEARTRAVRAARAAKGKNATLSPLVRRVAFWQEHGLRVFVTARAQTQAERLVTLLRHQDVACKARLATFHPEWPDEAVTEVH